MAYENRSDLDRDPDRIESEIETTRSRIEARLDALTNEFTPSTIMDRALGVNEAHPDQDTFGLMVERARTNPFSAVMIAAGLAGMVLNKPDPRGQRLRTDSHYPIEPYSDDPAERIGNHIETLETQANDLSSSARAAVTGAAASVSSAVSGAVDSVTDTVAGAVSSARAKVSSGADEASRGYDRTRHEAMARGEEWRESARHAPAQAKAGAEYAADWVRANPLPAGLFALAAGATIASAFAATKTQAPRSRADAAEELYERAEQDVVKRRARRANVAAATAKAPKPKAKKPVVRKKPTTAKAATPTPRSTAKSKTLGKNLDRSVAVQGKSAG